MTFDDVMDRLWPGSSAEARDELLWLTPFPFVNGDAVVKALEDLRTRYGPKIGDAIKGELDDFDRQVEDLKARGQWVTD